MRLNVIPFLFFFVVPLTPIIFFFVNGEVFNTFFILLIIYSLYKLLIYVVFSFIGLIKIYINSRVNWKKKVKELKKQVPKHLVAIAVNKESCEILEETLNSITNQNYPKERIFISVSFEERNFNQEIFNKIEKLLKSSKLKFKLILHPDGLKGEVRGAAANKSYAVKSAVEILEESEIQNYIVTIPDADTVFSPNYFMNLSYEWMKNEKRDRRFFQTAHYKIQNNYSKLRLFSKIISTSLTLSVLSAAAYRASKKYTWSCFSLSLKTLIQSDYWDTTIAIDDTPFFWRPYTLFNADWKCVPIYSSISVHGVYHENFFENIKSQYEQFYRWGFGIISFKIGLHSIWKNKKIRLFIKIKDTLKIFEAMIFVKVSFATMIIATILFTIEHVQFNYPQIFNLFWFLSLSVVILKLILISYTNIERTVFSKTILIVSELPLNIINLIFFGYFPYAHSALDYALELEHHEKIKWSDKK